MPTAPGNNDEGLKRELGVIDIAASVVNITVGSGIFLLPALVAAILGGAGIVAYMVCGLLYFCIMLCFAEMSGRINSSGGAYVYIERAFGPFAGFIANNLFWFCGVLLCAALVNGIADMLSVPFPVFDRMPYRILLFTGLFGFVAYSNIAGVKQGMRVVKLVTVLKLLPLALLVVIGLFQLNFDNLAWNGLPRGDMIASASLLLFAAYLGGESAASLGGEMKDARRTGPRGLLLGIGGVIIFYMLIHLVAQSSLGDSLAGQKAPLAAVAGSWLGNWAVQVLIVCGIVSIFGGLYSSTMVFSRVLFAGAFNGLLPRYLSAVHPRYATPHWSILTLTTIALVLACTGGYRQLLVVATISMMLLFVGVAMALIRYRLSRKLAGGPVGFKVPGGIIVPVLTLAALAWLLYHSKQDELIGIGIFTGALTVIYTIRSVALKTAGRKRNSPDTIH